MADRQDHWFFKNEHITTLLSLSEKIGNMVLSVNEAMTRFAASDTFANLVNFLQSIPDDIQKTELSCAKWQRNKESRGLTCVLPNHPKSAVCAK